MANFTFEMNTIKSLQQTKIAIVHDWLTLTSGSEEVLRQIIELYPEAVLYTLVDAMSPGDRDAITRRDPVTSFIQHLPMGKSRYRWFLPLMPLAIEQFDLSAYDVVISSSHSVAKGVITGPDQLHVSYIHTPIRYAWDLSYAYLRESGLERGLRSILVRGLLHYIRLWDVRTTNGVDVIVANSHFVARRIWKYYRRTCTVINPPVDIEFFTLTEAKAGYYLCVSRMVPYKRVDLVVKAFSQMPDKRLVVAGGGPDLQKMQALATSNVKVLGYQTKEALRDLMQNAKALVYPAVEDFGLVPVEAQACGTPVIAYGKGGVCETVSGLDEPSPTGLFFEQQTDLAIREAVELFEKEYIRFHAVNCRQNVEKFSVERFQRQFSGLVEKEWLAFNQRLNQPEDLSGMSFTGGI